MRPRRSDDAGAAVLGLVVTVLVVLVAAGLLQRTSSLASSINDKAKDIALTGRGINESTDSIIQLNRTNELATSILNSAVPLQGKLSTIVNEANTINGSAASINGSAGSINGSAVSINGTAKGIGGSATSIGGAASRINGTAGAINAEAGRILDVARSLDRGVAQININLDGTIPIANAIRSDTGGIVGQAVNAKVNAACINGGLLRAQGGSNGECR
jgi:methyl-accepting chemotaxis protein